MSFPRSTLMRMTDLLTKRPDIQIPRAIAVSLVVVFHLDIFENSGFLGVDVFFVISGYVITSSLIRRQGKTRVEDAIDFLRRRVIRLAPALIALLAFTLLFSSVFLSPYDLLPVASFTALAALFGAGNLAVALQSGDYFATAAESNPLLHTWSLGVEEQFYLLLAILLALGLGARLRKGAGMIPEIFMVAIVSYVAFVIYSLGYAMEGWQTVFGFYSPVTRAWEIAAGVLLATWSQRQARSRLSDATSRKVSVASLALILLVSLSPVSYEGSYLASTTIVVVLTAIVIHYGFKEIHVSNSLIRPLIWLGNASYSTYLWHWPIIVFFYLVLSPGLMAAAISLAITGLMTWVSFKFFEFPWKKSKEVSLRTASASLSVPVSIALALALVFSALSWSFQYPESRFQSEQGNLTETVPCIVVSDLSSRCGEDYGFSQEMLLVGDSTALPYFSAAAEWARNNGMNFTFSSSPGCPATRPGLRYPREKNCVDWQQSVADYISRNAPEEIWIINRGGAYANPDMGFYSLVDETGKLLRSSDQISNAWRNGLQYLLSQSSDSRFVIFHSSPEATQENDQRTLFNLLAGLSLPDDRSVPRLEANEIRENALLAEMGLVATSLKFVDPFDTLCESDLCPFT